MGDRRFALATVVATIAAGAIGVFLSCAVRTLDRCSQQDELMAQTITIALLCIIAAIGWTYLWICLNMTEDPYDR